jgi:hypothetical protein
VTWWLLVVLAVVATYRVTRLINRDTITAPLRRAVLRLDERHGPMEDDEVGRWTYFITCPWCVSMYVAAIIATVTVLWGDNRVVLIGLLTLAGSAVTGWLSSWEAE